MTRLVLRSSILLAALFLSGCRDDPLPRSIVIENERLERINMINQIPDERIRDMFRSVFDELHEARIIHMAVDQPFDGVVRYETSMDRRQVDYRASTELIDAYLQSIWVHWDGQRSLAVVPPFDYTWQHTATWDAIGLSDGSTVPVRGTYDGASEQLQAVIDGDFITLRGELKEGVVPVRLDGQFAHPNYIQPPDTIASFSPDDVGDVQMYNGLKVVAEQIGQNTTTIAIRAESDAQTIGALEDVVILAQDASEQFLARAASTNKLFDQTEAALEKLDQLATSGGSDQTTISSRNELMAQVLENNASPSVGGVYLRDRFEGQIARVMVLPVFVDPTNSTQVRDVTAPVVSRSARYSMSELPELAVTGQLFDRDAEARWADVRLDAHGDRFQVPMDLSPDQFADMVDLSVIDHSDKGFLPFVQFTYPNVQSDNILREGMRFPDLERSDLRAQFFDGRDNPLEATEPDAYFYVPGRISYNPELFAQPPARLTGQIEITVASDMEAIRIADSEQVDGVEIVGNQVRVSEGVFDQPDGTYRLQALDAGGNMIQYLTTVSANQDGGIVQVSYFAGTIAIVTVLKSGPFKRLPYAFDIALDRD